MKFYVSLFFACTVFSGYCQSLVSTPKTANELYALGFKAHNERAYATALAYLYAYWQKKGTIDGEVITVISYLNRTLEIRTPCPECPVCPGQSAVASTKGLIEAPPVLPAENKPQTYPLVIRGMGNADFEIITEAGTSSLKLYFKRAAISAGMNRERKNQLKPLEAAWLDRPIGVGEPDNILMELPTDFRLSAKGGVISANYSFFEKLRTSTEILTVDAYNNGQGSFISTTQFRQLSKKRKSN
jgi:hypothetical protein